MTLAAFLPAIPAQAYWGGVRMVAKFDNSGRPMTGKCMSYQGDGYITVVAQPRLEGSASGGGSDTVFRYDMIADEAQNVTPHLGGTGQRNFFCDRPVNALLSLPGADSYSFYSVGDARSVAPLAENLTSRENLRGMTMMARTGSGVIFELNHYLYRLAGNGAQKLESGGAHARAYSRKRDGGEYFLWRKESGAGEDYSLRAHDGGGSRTVAEYAFRPALRKPRITDYLCGDQAFVVEEKIQHTKTKSETQFKIHHFGSGGRRYASSVKVLPELFSRKIIALPDGHYAMLCAQRLIKFRPGNDEMLIWEWEKSDLFRENRAHLAGTDVVYVDGIFYILGSMGGSPVLLSVPESEVSGRL